MKRTLHTFIFFIGCALAGFAVPATAYDFSGVVYVGMIGYLGAPRTVMVQGTYNF